MKEKITASNADPMPKMKLFFNAMIKPRWLNPNNNSLYWYKDRLSSENGRPQYLSRELSIKVIDGKMTARKMTNNEKPLKTYFHPLRSSGSGRVILPATVI